MAKNKQKSSVTTILVRIVAVLLLVIGLVLIFNKQISNQMIKHNQQSALTTLTKKQVEANQKKKGMYDFSKVKSMNMGQLHDHRLRKLLEQLVHLQCLM